jgi:SAM-dependent MidA family methyltransferase
MTPGEKSAESSRTLMPAQDAARSEAQIVRHLAALIQRGGGRISFRDFMEAALYHPQHGYYKQDASPIGARGDFFTAVSATPVFGRILARSFLRLKEQLGRPSDFEVVEFGGHRGRLREDVLAEVPDLRYRVIEAGETWPEAVVGCIFSNEFLDALPVHRVRVVDGAWQELFVTGEAEGFAWQAGPLSEPRLAEALADLPAAHMEGYETEVNLGALDWMAEAGRRLRRGWVVTVDYGFERTDYFAPQRPRGTLRAYFRHAVNDDVLSRVGRQDLTAHVEFTSLIEAGRRAGLEPVLFTDLAHFLVAEGQDVIREISERNPGALSRERQGLHQLLHPGFMGAAFRVLVQEKR